MNTEMASLESPAAPAAKKQPPSSKWLGFGVAAATLAVMRITGVSGMLGGALTGAAIAYAVYRPASCATAAGRWGTGIVSTIQAIFGYLIGASIVTGQLNLQDPNVVVGLVMFIALIALAEGALQLGRWLRRRSAARRAGAARTSS